MPILFTFLYKIVEHSFQHAVELFHQSIGLRVVYGCLEELNSHQVPHGIQCLVPEDCPLVHGNLFMEPDPRERPLGNGWRSLSQPKCIYDSMMKGPRVPLC